MHSLNSFCVTSPLSTTSFPKIVSKPKVDAPGDPALSLELALGLVSSDVPESELFFCSSVICIFCVTIVDDCTLVKRQNVCFVRFMFLDTGVRCLIYEPEHT